MNKNCNTFDIVNAFGECESCPGGSYSDITLLKRVCTYKNCPAYSVLDQAGNCNICPGKYTGPDALGQNCVTIECSPYARINESSECEDCPAG